MAAAESGTRLSRYEENTCYGEEDVGYRIRVDGTDVTAEGGVVIPLDGTINTQTVTVTVENNKAPDGIGTYTLNILKSPPVEVTLRDGTGGCAAASAGRSHRRAAAAGRRGELSAVRAHDSWC